MAVDRIIETKIKGRLKEEQADNLLLIVDVLGCSNTNA
jgi:hypothetical protein